METEKWCKDFTKRNVELADIAILTFIYFDKPIIYQYNESQVHGNNTKCTKDILIKIKFSSEVYENQNSFE